MTTSDPLLQQLRQLPRPVLEDVATARALARAEAAFVVPRSGRPQRVRFWVPAALSLWGLLYAWSAVRELGRLFPSPPPNPVVTLNHLGGNCGQGAIGLSTRRNCHAVKGSPRTSAP